MGFADCRINKTIRWLLGFVLFLFVFNVSGVEKIQLDITSHLGDVREFMEGDEIAFLISIDVAAHVVVLYQNADREIIQLLPNKSTGTYSLKAGRFIPIPDPRTPFVFKIEPPFGKEVLWVFATDVPTAELNGNYRSDGTKKLAIGIEEIKNKLMQYPVQAFGEASYVLQTKARGRTD